LEIADCHGKVHLHQIKIDSRPDFILKIRLLAKTVNDFADFLESIPESAK
jgi:hypothetical protein